MQITSEYVNSEIIDIYNRNVDMIYRLSFAYLKNSEGAEDCVQDVFVNLLKSKKVFENVEHEKAWIIVTTINICKNKLKNFWNRRVIIGEFERGIPFEIDDTLYTVMKLPTKYKEVVYLYYYEGYNSTQISKILKKPESTIRNHLSEARKKLKKILGGDMNEK